MSSMHSAGSVAASIAFTLSTPPSRALPIAMKAANEMTAPDATCSSGTLSIAPQMMILSSGASLSLSTASNLAPCDQLSASSRRAEQSFARYSHVSRLLVG